MSTEEETEKVHQWFNRDGLFEKIIPNRKGDNSEADIEFSVHPNVITLRAMTDRGDEWVERYKGVMTPAHILEIHERTGDYFSIHKIRLLDLAKRSGLTCSLVGTHEELDWWGKFTKTLIADLESYNNAAKGRAIMFGGPTSFHFLDAFKPIHRGTRRL